MKTVSRFTAIAAVLLASTSAFAADWSSNSVTYTYAPHQSEPGVSDKVAKNIMTFTHVSGDKLGSNLFNIDLLKSNSADLTNGGAQGAQEWYGFYQRNFSLNAMTGNKTGYGIAKDLNLTARVDAGAKNTEFASAPRKLRLGMSAAMPVSAGFWDIGVAAYKENNNNGIVGKSVSFDVAPSLSSAWAIPIGGIGTFGGFASVVGPKGKDGFGDKTATETLIRATFMFDVMGPKSGLTAGVGVEYWNNKFGCDSSVPANGNKCKATTPLVLVSYAL
ncbi:MAG: hypothetical protein RLZZ296_541 [Pseudomonadota bacterium]|jgi:hypothetical protein